MTASPGTADLNQLDQEEYFVTRIRILKINILSVSDGSGSAALLSAFFTFKYR